MIIQVPCKPLQYHNNIQQLYAPFISLHVLYVQLFSLVHCAGLCTILQRTTLVQPGAKNIVDQSVYPVYPALSGNTIHIWACHGLSYPKWNLPNFWLALHHGIWTIHFCGWSWHVANHSHQCTIVFPNMSSGTSKLTYSKVTRSIGGIKSD